MTLTDPRPAAPVPSRAAPPVLRVHAVVIADSAGADLDALLDALDAQSLQPDVVTVLDRTSGTDAAAAVQRRAARVPGWHPPAVVDGRRGWPAAADLHRVTVEHLLPPERPSPADDPAPGPSTADVVWALPVGTLPEPATLERLAAAWRRSPSTGVVGPKHVDAEDPSRLRSLGIFTTRTGRVIADPPAGEPDQGQYDRRSDVLAVPLAGALIERDLIVALGGWQPSFRAPGSDLDFGWRSHAAGRRVVVVPSAVVRSGPGLARATADTGAERRGARRVALTRCAWWTAPLLALWVGLSSVGAALALALLKRPGAAVHELGDLGSAEPVRPLLARLRTRGRPVVRRRDLSSLFVPGTVVARRVVDELHDALALPSRDPERTDIEIAPRSAVAHALRNPGVLAVLAVVAAAAVAGRTLGVGLLRGIGGGLDGGEVRGSVSSADALWHGYLDGWHGPGLGGTTPASPALAALAIPAWVLEHLPGAPSSPGGEVVALALVLALPLGAVAAYLALRVVTTNPWLRGAGALAWATSGAATAAVAQGRLGGAVALVLLPAAAAGLVLLCRRDGSATAAFATALVATVLGAFAPALLLVVMLVALVALVGGARLLALPVLLVPPVLLGPWVLDAVHDPRLLLTGPGLSQWGGTVPPDWQLALGHVAGAGATPYWVGIPLAAAGLAGLVRGRSQVAAWALALVGLLGLALALAAPRVRLATVPAGLPEAGRPVTPWTGAPLLVVALVLVAAAVLGLAEAPLRRPAGGAAALARWPVLAALIVAAVGGAVLTGWSGFGTELHAWSDPRLEAAADQAAGDPAGRTLFVTVGRAGAAYRVVGRETGSPARILPAVDSADRSLAPAVAGLLDGSPGSWDAVLAGQAVGMIGVRDGAEGDLGRRLDSTDGLTRLSRHDGWSYWRVRAVGTGDRRPATPPRLRLDTAAASEMVPTTGQDAATAQPVTVAPGSTLVVAEPSRWARYATVTFQGRVLTPEAGTRQPTYAVPAGSGALVVDVDSGPTWWRLVQGIGLVVLLFLAVPFGRRQSRRRR